MGVRCCCHILVILLALVLWAAYSTTVHMNYGFKWTPEQLKTLNRLQNCHSEFVTPSATTSAHFAPAEDIEVDLEEDMAVLSVADLQVETCGLPKARFGGGLSAYYLGTDVKTTLKRKGSPKLPVAQYDSWNPVGLSLLWSQDMESQRTLRIFSVNLDRQQGRLRNIVVHRYVSAPMGFQELVQEHVFKHDLLADMNDVAAISPTEFYVTNTYTGPFRGTMIPDILAFGVGWGSGNLVYCNIESRKCKVVADGFVFTNSVQLSLDGKLLYLTESGTRTLHIYERDTISNEITLIESVKLTGIPDNINIDTKGRIWIAATMDAAASFGAILTPEKANRPLAPGIVYRLTKKTNAAKEVPPKWNTPEITSVRYWVETLWVNNGDILNVISVAAPSRNNKVLLSSLIDAELIECDVPLD